MALRTIVVDDEHLAVDRLSMLCAPLEEIILIGTATDGDAAVRMIRDLAPDLVLLDVSMPELDGIGVARAAGGMAQPPAIVFCTAFEQFAVEAFDVAAVDYLLKPVTAERLARAVSRVEGFRSRAAGPKSEAGGRAEEFWVPFRGELIRIDATVIDWIEADRDYMRLHVGSRSYLLLQTIANLEMRLDPERFLRVHRSHIVQRNRVRSVSRDAVGAWMLSLENGTRIRVGRSFLQAVRRMTTLR